MSLSFSFVVSCLWYMFELKIGVPRKPRTIFGVRFCTDLTHASFSPFFQGWKMINARSDNLVRVHKRLLDRKRCVVSTFVLVL